MDGGVYFLAFFKNFRGRYVRFTTFGSCGVNFVGPDSNSMDSQVAIVHCDSLMKSRARREINSRPIALSGDSLFGFVL